MRMQILEVPGGKPILVVSENPGAEDFKLDVSDEDNFLTRCGLGGVIVSEHKVFLDATPYVPAIMPPPLSVDPKRLDEWQRSLPTIRPQVTCTAFGQYPAPVMSKCDATCTNGAGCACDDDESPVGPCMYGPCTSHRPHAHGIECVDACRCRKAKKARADA